MKLQREHNKKEESLIKQVLTRWNSMWLMISRILENEEILRLILSNDAKHKSLILTALEKESLQDALEILKPFYDVTLNISSEKNSTISLIFP